MVSLYNPTTVMSLHMMSPQEWITATIVMILMNQHIKTVPITNNTAQPMNMAPAPTQPKKTLSTIPKIIH